MSKTEGNKTMRRVYLVIAALSLLPGSFACAPATANPGALLAKFTAAQASGNVEEAARIAADISACDFSATPLQSNETRALHATLADELATAGRLQEAVGLLERIVAEDRAALAQASDPGARSTERTALIAHLEKLGDTQVAEGSRAAALQSYTLALNEAFTLLGREEPQTRFLLKKIVDLEDGSDEAKHLQRLEEIAKAQPLASLGANPNIRGSATPTFETVRVFYGASRNYTGSEDPERAFGDARGSFSLGSVLVTVPISRKLGTIPRPGWFDFAGARDGIHIVLKRIERDNGTSAISERLKRSVSEPGRGQRDAFVYIHGYNETFADAARRTAQLAVELDMRNGAVFYSWPAGDLLRYQVAQNNVGPSVEELVALLQVVINVGAERVHIFAHSMGNRILLSALEELQRTRAFSEQPAFGQVVFASPDVDAEDFLDRVVKLKPAAQGFTLYASMNDRALQLSRWLGGGYQRAGQVPIGSAIARAVVSVDTSLVRRPFGDLIAHADYAGGAINDLRAIVWLSLAPQARCILSSHDDYWEASDSRIGCEDAAFRRAISAVRLYGANARSEIELHLSALSDPAEVASWRTALRIVRTIGH